jgi:hypothetical protein
MQDVWTVAAQRPAKLVGSDARTLSWLVGIAKRCGPSYGSPGIYLVPDEMPARKAGDDLEGRAFHEDVTELAVELWGATTDRGRGEERARRPGEDVRVVRTLRPGSSLPPCHHHGGSARRADRRIARPARRGADVEKGREPERRNRGGADREGDFGLQPQPPPRIDLEPDSAEQEIEPRVVRCGRGRAASAGRRHVGDSVSGAEVGNEGEHAVGVGDRVDIEPDVIGVRREAIPGRTLMAPFSASGEEAMLVCRAEVDDLPPVASVNADAGPGPHPWQLPHVGQERGEVVHRGAEHEAGAHRALCLHGERGWRGRRGSQPRGAIVRRQRRCRECRAVGRHEREQRGQGRENERTLATVEHWTRTRVHAVCRAHSFAVPRIGPRAGGAMCSGKETGRDCAMSPERVVRSRLLTLDSQAHTAIYQVLW